MAGAVREHDLGVVQAGHQFGGDLRRGIGVAVPVQTSAGTVSEFRTGWVLFLPETFLRRRGRQDRA